MKKRQPTEIPAVPAGLSDRAAQLWADVMGSHRRPRSPGRIALFVEGLKSLTRADQAADILNSEGLTVAGRGMAHVHPLTRVEKDNRALFLACWSKLALYFDGQNDV